MADRLVKLAKLDGNTGDGGDGMGWGGGGWEQGHFSLSFNSCPIPHHIIQAVQV